MKTLICWFADNPIAANLLMLILLVGGITSVERIDKQVFPSFEVDIVRVSVAYPGAGPREVEQQICIRIEEAIEGLQGIKETRCNASLNQGNAQIEVANDAVFSEVLNAVKARVDSIQTFPIDSERPIVEQVKFEPDVTSIAVYGDADERSLKEYAEQLKTELSAIPSVPLVEIKGTRDYEVSIEISENQLRQYGLTLDSISGIIASNSLTSGGGLMRTRMGEIQIQVREQGYNEADFAAIPIVNNSDGSKVLLGDIAEIDDGFVEDQTWVRFNGQPAAFLDIKAADNPDVLETARDVNAFIDVKRTELPPGMEMTVWRDESIYFKSRLSTLQNNGLIGLVLVFILLLLFLRPALAVWVSVGIAVSFVGTLFVLPMLGTSLNMVTLFAFILVLGIVVDDAIIIGENIHRIQSRGTWGVEGSKKGTLEMASPVFFAVATSIIVFIPMFFLPGDFAIFMAPIATIPIIALAFSLVESLLILPAHLSHLKPEKERKFWSALTGIRRKIADTLDRFLVYKYRPFLRKCLHHRALTMSCFVSAFILILAFFIGGFVKYVAMPYVPVEYVRASATMPAGTPFDDIKTVAEHIESSADRAVEKAETQFEEPILKNLFVLGTNNLIEVVAELTSPEERKMDTLEFVRILEEEIGEIEFAEDFSVIGSIAFGGDADIEFELQGNNLQSLEEASNWVKRELGTYPGIYNVRDSLSAGRPEMEISPSALASILGVTPATLSQQSRQIFYGNEVQRIPRGREDVRVMVRYPEEERSSTYMLENLLVRTPDQREIPFNAVAETRFVQGYASITRIDRNPVISVYADFSNDGPETSEMVVASFVAERLPELQQNFPGTRVVLEGAQAENAEFFSAIMRYGGMALMVIYGLLAIQFRSLSQPLIILAAIPFGFAGAVVAHYITGQPLSMLSMLGILAAAGVIVNDTLVFIDRSNTLRASGFSIMHSVIQSGRDRFRPIFLTSATTFVGLTPLMLEKSTQAKFLIPMATSLSAGVLAATVVTLVMVPCLYSLNESLRERLRGPRKYQRPMVSAHP